jgi:hypothetical protein
MTQLFIIPEALSIAIEKAIDKVLNGRPCDDISRASIRNELLIYFNEHGQMPEFELTEKEPEIPLDNTDIIG